MTMIIDTNTHTISGLLKDDAQHRLFDQNPDRPPTYRFKFRIGCRKTYRSGNDVNSRLTWFNVKFDVAVSGFSYFEERLKKGARILIVGEQLVDEEDGPAGRRYWQFIRASTINILVDAPVEVSANEPQQHTPKPASPQPAAAPRETPPAATRENRPPPPAQSRSNPRSTLRPSRPSAADAKEDDATRRRAANLPSTAFQTHLDPAVW